MTEENLNSCTETAPPKSRKRLWLAIAAVLLLFFIGGPVGLFFLLTAPWEEIPPTRPQLNDLLVVNKLVQRVRKEFSQKQNISRRATLEITPAEVNSLLKLAGNFKNKKMHFSVRYFRPHCSENGTFSFVLPLKPFQEFSIFKERTVFLYLTLRLLKKSDRTPVQCEIDSIRITRLPLVSSLRKKIQDEVNREMTEKQGALLESIKGVSFEKGKWIIIYDPQYLLQELARNGLAQLLI